MKQGGTLAIVAYYFPPVSVAGAERMYYHLLALSDYFEQIHLLVPAKMDNAYPLNEKAYPLPDHIIVHTIGSQQLDRLRKVKEGSMKYRKEGVQKLFQFIFNWFFFPDKGKQWGRGVTAKLKSIHASRSIDIVLSTSPLISAHLGVFNAVQKTSIRWIAEWRDFYYTHNSQLRGNKYKAKRLESSFFERANHHIFVCKRMAEILEGTYPFIKGKHSVVYNGVSPDMIASISSDMQTVVNQADPFKIVYAGTFYGGLRNPDRFLKWLECIHQDSFFVERPLEVHFFGPAEKYMQQSLKENYSYKFIFWHGSVSRQVATQAILNADAHLLLIPNIDAHSDTIPAKSFEYMLTGRSIIVDAPAQAAVFEVLEGYPFVINIQEDDPMQALEVLQEAARLQSREMGKIYGREEQSQQLQAIIQGLIKENSDYPKHD